MRTFRARARAREGRLVSPAVIGLIRCRVCGGFFSNYLGKLDLGKTWLLRPNVNLVNKSQCRGGGIVGRDTLKQLIDSKGLSKIGESAECLDL